MGGLGWCGGMPMSFAKVLLVGVALMAALGTTTEDVEPVIDDDSGFVAKMENEFNNKLETSQEAVNRAMGRLKGKRKGKVAQMRLEDTSDTDEIAKAEAEYQHKMAELKAFSEPLVDEATEAKTLVVPTEEEEEEDTEESELLQGTATEGFEEEEEPIDVALSGESRLMKYLNNVEKEISTEVATRKERMAASREEIATVLSKATAKARSTILQAEKAVKRPVDVTPPATALQNTQTPEAAEPEKPAATAFYVSSILHQPGDHCLEIEVAGGKDSPFWKSDGWKYSAPVRPQWKQEKCDRSKWTSVDATQHDYDGWTAAKNTPDGTVTLTKYGYSVAAEASTSPSKNQSSAVAAKVETVVAPVATPKQEATSSSNDQAVAAPKKEGSSLVATPKEDQKDSEGDNEGGIGGLLGFWAVVVAGVALVAVVVVIVMKRRQNLHRNELGAVY